MADATVPTLGPDGWARTPQKIFDYMLAHFFESEYSQDYLFEGSISSLPWIVRETQGDVTAFCTLLQRTLTSYFGRAFTNVLVDVAEVETTQTLVGEVRFFLQVQAADGTVLNASKLIQQQNSVIKAIIDYQKA